MSMYISEAEGLEFLKTVQVLLASEFKRLTPHCPKCSLKMVKCINSETDRSFWGCCDYPNCNGSRFLRRARRRDRVEAAMNFIRDVNAAGIWREKE